MNARTQLGRGAITGLLLFGIPACVDVPELGDRVPPALDQADYPALAPIERLIGPETATNETAETLANQLNARRARLQRRAAALQGQIVDAETRARMAAGVNP